MLLELFQGHVHHPKRLVLAKVVPQLIVESGRHTGEDRLDRAQLGRARGQVKMAYCLFFEELPDGLLSVEVDVIQKNSAALNLCVYLFDKFGNLIGEEDVIFKLPMKNESFSPHCHTNVHWLLLRPRPIVQSLTYVHNSLRIPHQKLSRESKSISNCHFECIQAGGVPMPLFWLIIGQLFLAVADVPEAPRNHVNRYFLLEVSRQHRSNF